MIKMIMMRRKERKRGQFDDENDDERSLLNNLFVTFNEITSEFQEL